jgi:large subunit ribosomal protein L17
MRHRKSFNHLGRTSAHRKAMLSNMAASLILHKRINTTLAKAKALKSYVEPLLTRAKEDSTHNRRIVFAELQNKDAVNELFRDVVVKIGNRPGGYTRILKTGTRLGDNAEMCILELVDYNENMLQDADSKKKTTRRRRSRKKASDEATVVDKKPVEAKKAEVKPEVADLKEIEQQEPEVKTEETPVEETPEVEMKDAEEETTAEQKEKQDSTEKTDEQDKESDKKE